MHSIWEKSSFVDYDIIIIGSGILGLSTAVSIKERYPSKDILILERGTLPAGASTRNAGFACFGSLTEILSDIKRNGEDATAGLVEKRWKGINMLRKRLGDDNIGFLNYGGYGLLMEKHANAVDKITDVNKLLYGIFNENVFFEDKDKLIEFGFDLREVKSLVHNPFESQIDTGKMMRSLISLAQSGGVTIINNYEATIDSITQDKVTLASHNSDVKFSAPKVISCSNAFTSFIIPEIRIKPGRGQVLATKPIPGLPFRGVFHFDEGFYYFRNYGERVIFGGGRNLDFDGEQTYIFGNTDNIMNRLESLLKEVILPGRKFEIAQIWSGIMGFNESKLPEVIRVKDNLIAGFCCNGMGVALASYVSEEIAGKIEN
jgi:glycine/D-amino acid oxidase-like deaminating enzyme